MRHHLAQHAPRRLSSVVALVLALAAAGPVWSASEGPAGRWEGTVMIPGGEIIVVVDLAQDGQGGWTGSATVPGFNVKGAPLAEIVAKDREVAFTIKSLGDPRFEGHLGEDGALGGLF